MKYHIGYFHYVLVHKWFVFLACCKARIPWRGIIHDWSKFLPGEWLPYVRKFDMPERPSVFSVHGDERNRLQLAGYRFKEDVDREFDVAWLNHQRMNKHHWQYWVLREDDGGTKVLEMPDVYMREMVADWRGAGRALGHPDTTAWYLENRNRILLHPYTRACVDDALGVT
jgi:hypothetical protein